MSDEKDNVTRREAIKTIGIGIGVIASLPVLPGSAQELIAHNHHAQAEQAAAKGRQLKFFTEEENTTLIALTERIIPSDESSPGAREARVNEYVDLVVSESSELTKRTWREGIEAIDKMSLKMFGNKFAGAATGQQIALLSEISRNEKSPSTPEERFFRTVKYATIDGYYTSEIGIHQELHYKGNTFLKEFTGCTHPEHQQ
jgi:hypothetical protein